MIVAVQSSDRLASSALPANVSGGRWIRDAAGRRLAFVEGRDGAWRIEAASGLAIRGRDGSSERTVSLNPAKRSVLNLADADGAAWTLVFYPDNPGARTSRVYGFSGNIQLNLGRDRENAIVYDSAFVSACHAQLTYIDDSWTIYDEGSTNGVFVNGERLLQQQERSLAFGDVIGILDLRVTVGRGFFSCNNPSGLVSVSPDFVPYRAVAPEPREDSPRTEQSFFYPALRFARTIERKTFTIDAPPQPEQEEETSLAMRIGPSLVMALASVLSASVFVTSMMESGGSAIRAVPMVAMAVSMLIGSVLWPILSSRSQKKRRAMKEAKRRAAYSQYLGGELAKIAHESDLQREILHENRIPVEACLARAYTGDASLMDRTPLHADYLELRLGLGEEPLQADIRFPDRHFSMTDDDIRRAVDEQAELPRTLTDVPVAYPLIDKPVLGVIGDPARVHPFLRGLAVQIAALHSYEDVKLMVLCDEADRAEWAFASHLPHCFADDRSMRFFACGLEEASELGMFMERVFEARRGADGFSARDAEPYYVVLCASEELADKADIVRTVVEERTNLGVSLIATAREMRDLPKECKSVIGLEGESAYLLDRDDPAGTRRQFAPDIDVARGIAEGFAFAMGKVRLDIASEKQLIPSRLGFLEMEHAGSVEHLAIAARWRESNASATLACPVGVDAQGEPFLLNLHEKFHGPHGLIAGTTGSGKSEFIISYILSMAVTYSPNDVAFVLIDYKGGGLAKAFDNEHVHLPHLAGVITNLDGAAITRSLVSIKSELKRRQDLFNLARDAVGGDNIDIYRYLDLFRQGRMTEPCPHLFIVADEFAELKQQQPDFMDELISAARIGRSLGVHLILATQKPSGVVNDQIWSNSRFKVCLKVADEADSREMIRRPDAAALTQPGRFYLLVGYNEQFALGQAAYAGTRYVARDRYVSERDDAVALVSDTGRQLVSVKPKLAVAEGEGEPESVAVLRLVEEVARQEGVAARQLWLEPVPELVTVDGVAAKYGVSSGGDGSAEGFDLNPVVGEVDDPDRQRQMPLTLPISRGGNVLVYGTADSGSELVLRALLYGMLRCMDSARMNVYALDFGSESLRAFAGAPQVGDVVCMGDDERVARFFDFIECEQTERRSELAPYGGSFERYAAAGGTRPAIVVVLNDAAAFMEGYPKLEDRLARLVRESGRGGVYLVMAADGTSSVRMRMRQAFRQVLACDLADPTDYTMIFGSMRGVPVPRGLGRGLVKLDETVLEFQAAHLCAEGDDYAFAMQVCTELADAECAAGLPGAPSIPTVPANVTPQMLLAPWTGAASVTTPVPEAVPYGIFEDTLEPARFEFEDSPFARVVYQRRKAGAAFAKALLETASGLPGWEVAILDVAQVLGSDRPAAAAYATRKPDLAASYLAAALAESAEDSDVYAPAAAPTRKLIVVTGITAMLNAAPFDRATELKGLIQRHTLANGVRVLLVDALADAGYTYEDWFKAQMTAKDGLWVGPGVDGQTNIGVSYAPGILPDTAMKGGRGYAVEGGSPRLVRLVSGADDETEAEA